MFQVLLDYLPWVTGREQEIWMCLLTNCDFQIQYSWQPHRTNRPTEKKMIEMSRYYCKKTPALNPIMLITPIRLRYGGNIGSGLDRRRIQEISKITVYITTVLRCFYVERAPDTLSLVSISTIIAIRVPFLGRSCTHRYVHKRHDTLITNWCAVLR